MTDEERQDWHALQTDGDMAARDRLLVRWKDLPGIVAVGYCRKRGVPRDDWDDAISEANTHLPAVVMKFDPSRGVPFYTFAGTFLTRRLLDHFRDRYCRSTGQLKHPPTVSLDRQPEEQFAVDGCEHHCDTADAVEWLLERCSDRERQLLRMRYLEGHTISEVAAAVGLSPHHVWKLVTAAKQRLRLLWESAAS